MQKYHFRRIFSLAACLICCLGSLTGCGKSTVAYDDVITNEGYDLHKEEAQEDSASYIGNPIAKEDLKVGVIHLTDPAEGSGYTYTHEIGRAHV